MKTNICGASLNPLSLNFLNEMLNLIRIYLCSRLYMECNLCIILCLLPFVCVITVCVSVFMFVSIYVYLSAGPFCLSVCVSVFAVVYF